MSTLSDSTEALAAAGDLAVSAYNAKKAQENAEKNLAFSESTFEYQKSLQQALFAREDNAVQRRVADLKAAGLSPVLAAGSAANAGSVVATTAPHAETPEVDFGLSEKVKNFFELRSLNQQIKNQKEQGDLMRSQREYYEAQAAKSSQEKVNLETINAGQEIKNQADLLDLDYSQESGINPKRQSSNPLKTFWNRITSFGKGKNDSEIVRNSSGVIPKTIRSQALENLGLDSSLYFWNKEYYDKHYQEVSDEIKRLKKVGW